MRRKIVIMLLMSVFTLLLAGCDFGNATTPTTSSTSSETTSSETTTTTSDTVSQTTTTTTTVPTTTSSTTTSSVPTTTTTSTTATTVTTTSVTTTSGVTTTTVTSVTTTTSGTVTTTTTTTDTNPPTTTTTISTTTGTTFDRQDLIDYVVSHSDSVPTSVEIEAKIAFYLGLFGLTSEEDLYYLLLSMDVVISTFNDVDTLQSAQNWYASAKALGFTKEIMVNVMTKMFLRSLEDEIASYDPSRYVGDIANVQQRIANLQQDIIDNRDLVVDYCTNNTDVATECVALYDGWIQHQENDTNYWDDYYRLRYDEYYDDFDGNLYSNLTDNIDNLLFYTYGDVDPVEQAYYQNEIDTIINGFTASEQLMYTNLLTQYQNKEEYYYSTLNPLENMLNNEMDYNNNYVSWIVSDYYYTYQDYQEQLQNCGYELSELLQNQQQDEYQFQVRLSLQAYFHSTIGNTKLRLLMETIYDILDHMIMNIDEETYDFILSILKGNIEFTEEDLTSENIVAYSEMLSGVISLLKATITSEDISNITSLAKDIFSIYLSFRGLTPQEVTSIELNVYAAIDQYATAALDTLDEIQSFVDSIDITKADAIIDFIYIFANGSYTEDEMGIHIAEVINTLFADNSFDVTLVTSYLIEIYFDLEYDFSPTEGDVTSVKQAVTDNITAIMTLASTVKDFTFPLATSERDDLEEFKARIQSFAFMFGEGFETSLNPLVYGYDHQDFIDLIYRLDGYMSYQEAEDQILVYIDLFGLNNEADTYYTLYNAVQLMRVVEDLHSFTAFQEWFGRVAELGFSNVAIADYLFNFSSLQLDILINEGVNQEQIDDITNEIASIQSNISDWQDMLDLYDGEIMNVYDNLPSSYQADALLYWDALLTKQILYFEQDRLFSNAMDIVGFWDMDAISSAYDNYLYYYSLEDYNMADDMFQQYQDVYVNLSLEQQAAVDVYIQAKINLFDHTNDVLNPLTNSMSVYSEYDPFFNITSGYVWDYAYYQREITEFEGLIVNLQDEILSLQAEAVSEAQKIQAFIDYLDVPANEQLIKDVIIILLDEIDNIVYSMNPETFDLLFFMFDPYYQYRHYDTFGVVNLNEEYYNPWMNIDLSASAILSYSSDVSTVLKALFATIDTQDMDKIVQLLSDLMEIQLLNDGLSQTEVDQKIADMLVVFNYYYPELLDTIGVITTFLDALTEAKIQVVIDSIKILSEEEDILGSVIAAARMINTLTADGSLDYEALLHTYLEIYFSTTYGMSYSTTDLENSFVIFTDYLDDLLLLAGDISTFDPATLTTTQMATIYEAKQLVEYLVSVLPHPTSISASQTFGYSHQDFYDLVDSFTNDSLEYEEIEGMIDMLVNVFDVTEEETFYQVLTYGPVVAEIRYVDSPEELVEWLNRVFECGITKAQMAEILITLAVQSAQNMLSYENDYTLYTSMKDSYDDYVDDLDAAEASLLAITTGVSYEIGLIADPNASALATQLWNKALYLNHLENDYQHHLEESMNEYWNWNTSIYDQLMIYRFGDEYTIPDMEAYSQYFDGLEMDEQEMYLPLLEEYQYFVDMFIDYQSDESSLESYHIYVSDGMTYIEVYLHDQRFAYLNADLLVTDCQQIVDEANDVLMNLEASARLVNVLSVLVNDPQNIDLMIVVLTSLLDEVDYISENIDVAMIRNVIWDSQAFNELPIEDQLEFIHNVGSLLSLLGTTLDATDLNDLNVLVDKAVFAYLNAFGDQEAMALDVVAVIDNHFNEVLSAVPFLSAVAGNVTEARLQGFLDQMAILDSVGDATDTTSNCIRAIAIANILDIVLLDTTIDSDEIISVTFSAYFDMQYALGYTDSLDTSSKVISIQTAFDLMVTRGVIIQNYDAYNLSASQLLEIDDFHNAVEAFGLLMEGYID